MGMPYKISYLSPFIILPINLQGTKKNMQRDHKNPNELSVGLETRG